MELGFQKSEDRVRVLSQMPAGHFEALSTMAVWWQPRLGFVPGT